MALVRTAGPRTLRGELLGLHLVFWHLTFGTSGQLRSLSERLMTLERT